MYNQKDLCSKGSIEIAGEQARRADETSCGSFHDREYGSAQNSTSEKTGCERIQVSCKAEGCTYNAACECTASAIDIVGKHASTGKGTECRTFCCGSRC